MLSVVHLALRVLRGEAQVGLVGKGWRCQGSNMMAYVVDGRIILNRIRIVKQPKIRANSSLPRVQLFEFPTLRFHQRFQEQTGSAQICLVRDEIAICV